MSDVWPQVCAGVLTGCMRAFDEPVAGPPSREAAETSAFVLASLRPLLGPDSSWRGTSPAGEVVAGAQLTST